MARRLGGADRVAGHWRLSRGFDEAAVLNANTDFLATELEVDSVDAYPVGEGEDVAGKARVAFPLEPGIAFL